MKRFSKLKSKTTLAFAAGLALVSAASSAMAGSVTYSTTGSFSAGSTGGTVSANSLTVGSATLTFNGMAPTVFTDPTNTTSFQTLVAGLGTFTLTDIDPTDAESLFDTAKFTLSITQYFPTLVGPNSATASVEGTISAASPLSSALIFTFVPTTIDFIVPSVGTYKYRPDFATIVTVNGATNLNSQIQMPANAPTIPLPSAIYAGVSLLGATALGRKAHSLKNKIA